LKKRRGCPGCSSFRGEGRFNTRLTAREKKRSIRKKKGVVVLVTPKGKRIGVRFQNKRQKGEGDRRFSKSWSRKKKASLLFVGDEGEGGNIRQRSVTSGMGVGRGKEEPALVIAGGGAEKKKSPSRGGRIGHDIRYWQEERKGPSPTPREEEEKGRHRTPFTASLSAKGKKYRSKKKEGKTNFYSTNLGKRKRARCSFISFRGGRGEGVYESCRQKNDCKTRVHQTTALVGGEDRFLAYTLSLGKPPIPNHDSPGKRKNFMNRQSLS